MPIIVTYSTPLFLREDAVLDAMIAESARALRRGHLLIAPASGWARQLEREAGRRAIDAARGGNGPGLAGGGVLLLHGWDRFVDGLSTAADGGEALRLIGNEQRVLLALRLLREAAPDLPAAWEPAAQFPGYAPALLLLFDETINLLTAGGLIAAGADAEAPGGIRRTIEAALRGVAPDELKKMSNGALLWTLLARWTGRLLERGWIDAPWREACAAAAVSRPLWDAAYPGVERVTFFGFDELGATARRVIEALDGIGLSIEIIAGAPGSTARWRNPADDVIAWARRRGAAIAEANPAKFHGAQGRPFAALAGSLFRDDVASAAPGRKISIAAFPTRRQEAEGIARLVKRRLAQQPEHHPDGPAAPRQSILIACVNRPAYAPLLKEALERHGLRARTGGGEPLQSQPIVQAALSLLSWAADDFPADALRVSLSSPYVRVSAGAGGALTPPDVEQIARLCRITRGGTAWRARAAAMLASHEKKIKMATMDGWFPEDDYRTIDDYVAALEAEAALLRVKGAAIAALLEKLSPLGAAMSAGNFTRLCLTLIREFISPIEAAAASAEALRQSGRERTALAALISLIETMGDTLGDDGNGNAPVKTPARKTGSKASQPAIASPFVPMTGLNYLQWLLILIEDAGIYPGGELNRSEPDIVITSIESARGMTANVMIFCGMTEGAFPTIERRNPLLSGDEVSLDGDAPQRHRQITLFRRMLAQARAEFIATHPLEEDGEVCIPSSILSELIRLGFADVAAAGYDGDAGSDGAAASTAEFWKQFGAMSNVEWNRIVAEWRSMTPQARRDWAALLGGLERAIDNERIEANRSSTSRAPGKWEGNLSGDARLAAYFRAWAADHIFSPTELEQIAGCGLRHLLERHAGLAERETLEEDISAIEAGLVLHQTLQKFFEEKMRAADFNPAAGVTLSPDHFDANLARLRAIASGLLAAMPYEGVAWEAWQRQFLGDTSDAASGGVISGTLRAFLEFELAKMTACHPRFLEVPFGRFRRLASKAGAPPVLRDGCRLELGNGRSVEFRGRMDRVDFVDGGGAAVWDYKSGRERTLREIQEGFLFQAALYAIALRTALPEMGDAAAEREAVCSGYYVIHGEKAAIPTGCVGRRPIKGARNNNALTLDDGEALARLHLGRLLGVIDKGLFAHTRDENFRPCGYCSFVRVCRKVEWKHEQYAAAQGYAPEGNAKGTTTK